MKISGFLIPTVILSKLGRTWDYLLLAQIKICKKCTNCRKWPWWRQDNKRPEKIALSSSLKNLLVAVKTSFFLSRMILNRKIKLMKLMSKNISQRTVIKWLKIAENKLLINNKQRMWKMFRMTINKVKYKEILFPNKMKVIF